jgi:hypothetical protein
LTSSETGASGTVTGRKSKSLIYGEANVAILIFCSGCGASLRVKDQCAGQVGICPKCKGPIFIASSDEETVLALPRPATQAQKEQARAMGIGFDEHISYKQLNRMIDEALESETEILDDPDTVV